MSNSNEKQISMGVLLVLNLLIGFVISNINLGVAPILATIAGTYPDVAKSSIQGLMTTPSYLALAFGLLAGVLNTKFSVKKLLAVGISWFAVMGLVPLFVTDFTVLSICRILTGFSAGMVVPTSVTFIMSYYPKEKIATALGIQTAAVTGGQIIVNMLGGKLGAVQYNKFFMLYFVVAVAAVCIILLLPDRGPIKAKKAEGGLKQYFTWQSLVFAVFPGLFWVGYTAYTSNIAFFIAQYFAGDAAMTGTVSAIGNVLSVIAGLLLGTFHKKFKNNLTGICLLGLAVGYGILGFATTSYALVVFSQMVIGFFMACVISHSRLCASSCVIPAGITLVNGFCTIFINVFKLSANHILNGISTAVFGNSDPAPVFLVAAVLTAIFGVLWILYVAYINAHPVVVNGEELHLPEAK